MQALKEYHEIAKELLKYLPNYRDEENSLIVESVTEDRWREFALKLSALPPKECSDAVKNYFSAIHDMLELNNQPWIITQAGAELCPVHFDLSYLTEKVSVDDFKNLVEEKATAVVSQDSGSAQELRNIYSILTTYLHEEPVSPNRDVELKSRCLELLEEAVRVSDKYSCLLATVFEVIASPSITIMQLEAITSLLQDIFGNSQMDTAHVRQCLMLWNEGLVQLPKDERDAVNFILKQFESYADETTRKVIEHQKTSEINALRIVATQLIQQAADQEGASNFGRLLCEGILKHGSIPILRQLKKLGIFNSVILLKKFKFVEKVWTLPNLRKIVEAQTSDLLVFYESLDSEGKAMMDSMWGTFLNKARATGVGSVALGLDLEMIKSCVCKNV